MRALLVLAALALLAGCAADYAGTIRLALKPEAPYHRQLSEEEFHSLSPLLRGGIERALAGENVTLDLSPSELEAARILLACEGASVFHFRGANVACVNDAVA